MLRLRGKSRRLTSFQLRPERAQRHAFEPVQPQSAAVTFLFKTETSSPRFDDALPLLAAAKRARNTVSRPVMSLFSDSFETRFNEYSEIRNELRDLLRVNECVDEDQHHNSSSASLTTRFYDLHPREWLLFARRLDEKTTDWPGILHDSLAHVAFEHVSTFLRAHESFLGLFGFCLSSRPDDGEGKGSLRRLSLDAEVIDAICRKVRAIYWPKGRGMEYCAILSRVLDEADPTQGTPFSFQTLENFVVTPMLREYTSKDLAARFSAAMANLQRARQWCLTVGMVRGVVNGAVFGSVSEADLHLRIDRVKAEVDAPLSLNFLIVEQITRKLRAVRFHSNETSYLLRTLFMRVVGEGIAAPAFECDSTTPFSQFKLKPLSSVDAILFVARQLLQNDILQLIPSMKGRLSVFSEILSFATEALSSSPTRSTGSSTPSVKWFSNSTLWKLVLSRVPQNEVRMLLGEVNCTPNWVKFDFPLSWQCGCGSYVCIALPECPSCSEAAGKRAWRCSGCGQDNSLENQERSAVPQLCASCLRRHPQLEVLTRQSQGVEVVPCSAGCGCMVGSDSPSCQVCRSPNTCQSTRCDECHSLNSGLRADCGACGKPRSQDIVLLLAGPRLENTLWKSGMRTESIGRVPDPSSAIFAIHWQCGCGASNSPENLNCWRCSRHYERKSFSCPQCLQQNHDAPQQLRGFSEFLPPIFSCNHCAALHPLSKALSQPLLCSCPNCFTVNRCTDAVCRHCDAALGSISELLILYPQGPWNCFECGNVNRIQLGAGNGLSLSTCSKCEAERPTSIEALKLEWSCCHCGTPNLGGFACSTCYSLRSGLPDSKAKVRHCSQCNDSTACFQKSCNCGATPTEYRYLPWDCLKCFKRNPATALMECSHCSHRRTAELCERCGDYHLKNACSAASEAKLLGVLEETLLAAGSVPTQENRSIMTQLSSLKPANWLKAATVFGTVVNETKRTDLPKAGRRRK